MVSPGKMSRAEIWKQLVDHHLQSLAADETFFVAAKELARRASVQDEQERLDESESSHIASALLSFDSWDIFRPKTVSYTEALLYHSTYLKPADVLDVLLDTHKRSRSALITSASDSAEKQILSHFARRQEQEQRLLTAVTRLLMSGRTSYPEYIGQARKLLAVLGQWMVHCVEDSQSKSTEDEVSISVARRDMLQEQSLVVREGVAALLVASMSIDKLGKVTSLSNHQGKALHSFCVASVILTEAVADDASLFALRLQGLIKLISDPAVPMDPQRMQNLLHLSLSIETTLKGKPQWAVVLKLLEQRQELGEGLHQSVIMQD